MAHGIDRLGELLLDGSLSATALLSLVALAMIACRQPVRRILLARAAILCVLVLIPLLIFAPLPRISLNRLAHQSGLLTHPIFAYQLYDHLNVKSAPGSGLAVRTEGVSGSVGSQLLLGLSVPPPRWLVVTYLVGTASALAWLLLGHWGLSWLTSHSEAVSPHSANVYESLPTQCRRPRVRVSARVRRPALVGLFRQTILIPAELDEPESADKLRLSLLHELAHAERNDSWFGLASSLAYAFWFFIPPLWWIRAQMRLDQEFLADRRAARSFGPFQSYAASLVKIASGESAVKPTATTQQRSQNPMTASALFLRVLMLVQCPFSIESRPPRWWAFSLASLLLLGTMAASCLTLRVTGSTAPSPPHPKAPLSKGHSFRMSRLVASPTKPAFEGRPQVYELPLALPKTFDLWVDIWADADSLPLTKVVGIPLLAPRAGINTPLQAMGWHQVRIRRAAGTITIELDQSPLATSADQKTTSSLTLESPAGYPVSFRNLRLTW